MPPHTRARARVDAAPLLARRALPLVPALALALAACGRETPPTSGAGTASPAASSSADGDERRAPAIAADPSAKDVPDGDRDPHHRPDLRLPPDAVLALLQQDNGEVAAARQRRAPLPPAQRRPSGARGRLAAILVCADAGLDLARVFRRAPEDVYWLCSPGPCVRSEEAALIVRAAREQEMSLAVILVHEGCASLSDDSASPLAESLRRRVAPARAIAADSGRSLALAYGLLQADLLLQSSADLAAMQAAGSFAVAVGVVQPSTGRIAWHTPWARPRPPR